MDEEVKRRRKEKEQKAVEQRLNEERMRKMEQENKHLLANLFSQKPMHNQSLALGQNPILKLNLSQNARIQPGSFSQLQRIPGQTPSSLQSPSQNLTLLSLQRNSSQTQQRTLNSWPNSSSTTSTSNPSPLPSAVSLNSNFSPFYPQSFMPSLPQLKNQPYPLTQTALSPTLSSKNSMNEILDLTISSPSPSPDSTEGGLALDGLTQPGFEDEFNLESLISQNATNAQHTLQMQQPLLLQPQQHHHQQQQQQHLQSSQQQQQNHNLLVNHHQNLLDLFDLSPQMTTQKPSPSPSSSSCSSSASSASTVSKNFVGHSSTSLPPASSLLSSSSSSSLFSSPSSSSLFSTNTPHFSPPPFLLPQSDPQSLPNGHCSTNILDIREALNSMLQAGPDRKSVIKYRPPE